MTAIEIYLKHGNLSLNAMRVRVRFLGLWAGFNDVNIFKFNTHFS
jgi:hypothetical protein